MGIFRRVIGPIVGTSLVNISVWLNSSSSLSVSQFSNVYRLLHLERWLGIKALTKEWSVCEDIRL
jgi:hypothetical protein